jgi:DTW domain-containing protein
MREHCYRCHKPRIGCVCALITPVHSTTPVFVFQHPRERFHAIGTARLLKLGLTSAHVQVLAPNQPSSLQAPELPEGAALLYPAADAPELASLPVTSRPSALVVIDATWAHSRSLYRSVPWLQTLPKVALAPARPSAYRIRKEPRAECLSTIEAVLQALAILEPQTDGFDGLLLAFTRMIDQQIVLRSTRPSRPYQRRRSQRASQSIPAPLRQAQAVLVHIETARHDCQSEIVYLSAERLGSGETFHGFARPLSMPQPGHLAKMGIPVDALAQAGTLSELQRAWREFVRDDDTLLAWSRRTLEVLSDFATPAPAIELKAVYCNHLRLPPGHLEELVTRHGLSTMPTPFHGRTGRRMSAARAVVDYLLKVPVGRQAAT